MCDGDLCVLLHLRVASVYGDVTSLDCGVAEMRRGTGERQLPTCAAPALEVDFKGAFPLQEKPWRWKGPERDRPERLAMGQILMN